MQDTDKKKNKYVTKFGENWSWVCMINNLKEGDLCTFVRSVGEDSIFNVHVDKKQRN